MKRTNAPPIPEGIRITLNGEEQEWKDVMQVFEDAGWVWVSGTKPHEKKICSYSTVETSSNKKIANCACVPITQELTATEFLQQYQCTIEYEVGDWVVILVDQSGDPVGTITQITSINKTDVSVKNVGRPEWLVSSWSATRDRIRPATPEEIASVTKQPVEQPKEPDVYIWDGDVLPDEYWVENPWPSTVHTEFVRLFNGMRKGNNIGGASRWYYVKDSQFQECHDYEIPDTDLPIVPYKLWKSILKQPDPLAEPVAIKPRYHIDNVMDQNIAISCPTIELWNAVTGLIPNNNRLTEENWKDYNSNDEIAGCNINQFGGNHCDISWYEDEKYTIITAGEFLRDNGVAVPQPRWSIVTTGCATKYAKKIEPESTSIVKKNIVPIGWKPGDSWRHKDGTCGLSISVHPKDGNPNMYFVDYAENATAWVEVIVINEFVAKGLWIINPDQKSKQEEKSQTIINKQSKTKQNEKGNSISITEQCIVINSNYINCKTSNATYVPGDEERITKGQRRQGSTVRG